MNDLFNTWAPTFTNNTAFGSVASAAIKITDNRAVLVFQPSTACYIKFGGSIAAVDGLASSSDAYFAANEPVRLEMAKDSSYMSILRVSSDGVLQWYREHSPASASSYAEILGPLLVEQWSADVGITLVGGKVDVWKGSIGGTALSAAGASNRMTYGADGSNFGGLPVCTAVRATPTYVLGTPAATLLPVGSRPYTFVVMRFTSTASNIHSVFSIQTGDAKKHLVYSNITPPLRPAYFSSVVNLAPLGATDTAVHAFEAAFSDGTNSFLALDGTTLDSSATNSSLTSAATEISIAYDSAATRGCDGAYALVLLCSSCPSTAQRDAVLRLAKQQWGF